MSSRGRTVVELKRGRVAAAPLPFNSAQHPLMIPIVAVLAMDEFVRMRFPLPARIRMSIEELVQARMIVHILAIVDQPRILV